MSDPIPPKEAERWKCIVEGSTTREDWQEKWLGSHWRENYEDLREPAMNSDWEEKEETHNRHEDHLIEEQERSKKKLYLR